MAGSAAFAALTPGTEFYDAVQAALGDPLAVGRAQTNTDAAFTVGFVVGAVLRRAGGAEAGRRVIASFVQAPTYEAKR